MDPQKCILTDINYQSLKCSLIQVEENIHTQHEIYQHIHTLPLVRERQSRLVAWYESQTVSNLSRSESDLIKHIISDHLVLQWN